MMGENDEDNGCTLMTVKTTTTLMDVTRDDCDINGDSDDKKDDY